MERKLTSRENRALVSRSQRGDYDAFAELMHAHRHYVTGCAIAALGKYADAENVAEEAFILAYQKLYQLRRVDSFRVWVGRIAWNIAVTHRKKLAPETTMDLHDPEHDRPSDIDAHGDWERRTDIKVIVQEILDVLPDRLREPFAMCYLGGGTHREIALSLVTTENAVQKRITRAIEVIRNYMRRTDRAAEWEEIWRSHGLAIAVGADFVARAMEGVRKLPPPKARQAGIAPSEWVSCLAAAVMTVGVLVSAFVGLRPTEAMAWGGAADEFAPTIELADVDQTPPRPPATAPTGPAMEARLTPATLATGWRPGIKAYDASVPLVADDDPNELWVVNATGVDREMEPAYGKVILSFSAQPPYNLRSQTIIALDIDYGAAGSYMSAPEIVKTYDNWWACAEDDPAPRDGTRTDYKPLRHLARYTGEKTRIRLVHHAQDGEYDIYIDNKLVANRVQRRWTAGLPVTGVHMRSGDAIWPGTGKLMRIWDMHVVVDPGPRPESVPERRRFRSTTARRATANITDLVPSLSMAVKLGNLPGIEAVYHDLSTFHPDHPLTAEALGYMDGIVRPARALEPASDARLTALRARVGAMDAARSPLDAHTAEQTFRRWAAEHAGVTEMWVRYEDERRKLAPNWSVRLPPEDYRGSGFLLQVATELVDAYPLLTGIAGRVTVNVRPPTTVEGDGHTIVEASSQP